jgi:hypothetical protein
MLQEYRNRCSVDLACGKLDNGTKDGNSPELVTLVTNSVQATLYSPQGGVATKVRSQLRYTSVWYSYMTSADGAPYFRKWPCLSMLNSE